MFWKKRAEKLQRTETDACRSCDKWEPPCEQLEKLAEPLKAGMHLDVVFCPHLRPPVGGQHG
jgi:hypothetical protein